MSDDLTEDELNHYAHFFARARNMWARGLQSRLAEYERIIGLVTPTEDFRRDVITIFTQYWADSTYQANQPKQEHEERAQRLHRARKRKAETSEMRAKVRTVHDAPGADKKALHDFLIDSFLQDIVAQQMLEAAGAEKGTRGPREKKADAAFVRSMAELYERTTGKQATTVTTAKGIYTGRFIELVKIVQQDMRDTLRERDEKTANTLSGNIGRYAKKVLSAKGAGATSRS